MLILNPDKKRYPRFTQFVQRELGTRVLSNKQVWQAFKTHSQVTEALAKKVLFDPTVGPLLRVANLGYYADRKVAGFFPDAHPWWILIDREPVQKFEYDYERAVAQQFIEAKVLHETVHWGDFHADEHSPSEPGEDFEKEAYGRSIEFWWD